MPSCIHCFEFGPCLEETAEVVGNIVHVDEGGQTCWGQQDQFIGRAELGRGVLKLIIRLNYNNL